MANPTTNYGFVLPTSSDLVTDLPADFDVALQGVDTRMKALEPATTLGDLQYASATANTNTRLGIGTTGQVLAVVGGVPSWATPSGGFPAWTSYAATVTPQSGSLTSYTATSYYSVSGKTCLVSSFIIINTNGTAAGTLYLSAPFTSQTRAGFQWGGTSHEGQTTGYSGWSIIASNSSTINARDYLFNTYFGTGNQITITMAYEVA